MLCPLCKRTLRRVKSWKLLLDLPVQDGSGVDDVPRGITRRVNLPNPKLESPRRVGVIAALPPANSGFRPMSLETRRRSLYISRSGYSHSPSTRQIELDASRQLLGSIRLAIVIKVKHQRTVMVN